MAKTEAATELMMRTTEWYNSSMIGHDVEGLSESRNY